MSTHKLLAIPAGSSTIPYSHNTTSVQIDIFSPPIRRPAILHYKLEYQEYHSTLTIKGQVGRQAYNRGAHNKNLCAFFSTLELFFDYLNKPYRPTGTALCNPTKIKLPYSNFILLSYPSVLKVLP